MLNLFWVLSLGHFCEKESEFSKKCYILSKSSMSHENNLGCRTDSGRIWSGSVGVASGGGT